MSVQSQINRITQAVSNAYTAVSNKGGTLPSSQVVGNLANAIGTIPTVIKTKFYIEAVENTTITLSKNGSPTTGTCTYGIDDETTPTSYTYGDNISLNAGEKCYFYITSSSTAFSFSNYLKFTSSNKINAGGNISSLIGGETTIPRDYCFVRLFYNCTNLVDISNLNLDVQTLANYCYYAMFYGCTGLTNLPSDLLPVTTLAASCYNSMFAGCTGLKTLPNLPATTLVEKCYLQMFMDCSNIKVSTTQTENYQIPFRIPTNGTGIDASKALQDMFRNTGGTFTGAPTINTTYYLQAPVNIKAKHAIALNGDTSCNIDLGKVCNIVLLSAGAGQRSQNTAATTFTLSCGETDYTSQTIQTESIPHGGAKVIEYRQKIKARYIRAYNSFATWNSVSLSIVYEE